jgi:succinoglycan biosynthesis protein ExoM
MSIFTQDCVNQIELEIVICDDDPNCSAGPLIEPIAKSAPVPIRYVVSGANNVSAARNACLAAATGTWVAFIDDDEKAQPDWISHLLAAQRGYDADIVKGYVRGIYPGATPGWLLSGDPYTRDCGPTGTQLHAIATCNVMLRRAFAISENVNFDMEFGRSGGEDTDFFRRLALRGARAVACREAVVNEIVPPDRVTFRYIESRYLRYGQTDGRKIATKRADVSAASAFVKGGILVALLWAYPAAKILGGRAYFWCFTRFCYYRGILEGLRGVATEQMAQ